MADDPWSSFPDSPESAPSAPQGDPWAAFPDTRDGSPSPAPAISNSPPSFLSRVAQGNAIQNWVYDKAKEAKNAGWAEATEDAKAAWDRLKGGYEDTWSNDFWTQFLAPPKMAAGAFDIATLPFSVGFGLLGRAGSAATGGILSKGDIETALMALPAGRAPLVDAGGGNLAKLTTSPEGKVSAEVVGTYPPTHADFENAAASVAQRAHGQEQPSNIEGKFVHARMAQRTENPITSQTAAAQEGSGTTFPPANDEAGLHARVQSKLHQMWEDQGLHPAEVAQRVKDDPVMAHDLSAARAPTLPLPERPSPQFVKEMDDKFYRLRTSSTADKAEFLQILNRLPDSIKDPEVQELWYRYMEGDDTVTMPPELGKQYNEIMGPLKEEETRLFEEAKKTDLDVDPLNPNYAHRIVVGRHPVIDALTGEAAADENPIYNGPGLLKRSTSSMENRKFYALEDAAGNRQLVVVNKDGDLLAIAKGSKREIAKGIETPTIGDTFDVDGRQWSLTHALTREIEDATSVRYYKNALANTIDNILHLRAVNRAVYTVQTLRDTPEWAAYTGRRGDLGVPKDWRTPDLPLFTNDVMHPYLAEVADDFYKKRPTDGLSATLQKVNRFAVGSLFWTPIPHVMNAASHWAIERSWDWITPQGLKSIAVDGARAIRSVVTQDKTYQRMLRDGSGLIYGGIANRDFYSQLLRDSGAKLASDPAWNDIAAITKLRPDRLIASIYNASSRALWAVSDMFMVQRLLELERKGVAPQQAIEMAERHIPNYRLPPRMLGSRSLKQGFGNPFLFNFSRYHYGVLKGYANMAKELVSGDPEEMIHATGAIMAFGVLQLVVWPGLSVLVQKITGDSHFSVPSYGPGRLVRPIIGSVVAHTPGIWPDWVKDYYKDNPEFLQQLSNMVVFSPVFNFALEEFENRYNFTGRPITEPSDWRQASGSLMSGQPDANAFANVARTQGEHAAQSFFLPYNSVNQAWRKGIDPGTALIQSLFGVQYTTEQQEAAKERAFRYQDHQAVRRQRKPVGLIESLGR